MNIPPFTLPSNHKKTVIFRENTVEDCLEFCALDDRLDELSTTSYLNSLQVGELQDSALWTTQDRRTALWWIFVISNKDTTIALNYQCAHCNEEHTADIDLVDLDDAIKSMTSDCFIKAKMLFSGIEKEITIKPITGRDAEHIERLVLRMDNLPADTIEHRKAAAELKLTEIACAISFHKEPSDYLEALTFRIAAIKTMNRTSEFADLVAAIESAYMQLVHGLEAVLNQGKLSLVSPPVECENAKGDQAKLTRLLIPFRGQFFIPEL